MMAIAPLMIEHRLIERIVPVLQAELRRLDQNGKLDAQFIDSAADFFRMYSDKCHHGKEEDILFRALSLKPLTDAHRQTMSELVEQHVFGRAQVGELLLHKDRCMQGDAKSLANVKARLKALAEYYPKHIELEDRHFFIPCMGYFTDREQEQLLQRFADYDRTLVHQKYKMVLEDLQRGRGL